VAEYVQTKGRLNTFDLYIRSFGHSSTGKQPILGGNMPFKRLESPLKSGLFNFLEILRAYRISSFSFHNQKIGLLTFKHMRIFAKLDFLKSN
jgi:hypothetical protein